MADIKPLETIYNGKRFRSRLEARWAVFFDLIKVEYEYEPEGFEFQGYRYLPDFYVPSEDVYIEIKSNGALTGNESSLYNGREEAGKYIAFSQEILNENHGYIVICGTPTEITNREGFIYRGDMNRPELCNGAYKGEKFIDYFLHGFSGHRNEGKIADYIRFEHGETYSGFVRECAENYYLEGEIIPEKNSKTRKGALRNVFHKSEQKTIISTVKSCAKALIGMACLFPYYLLDDNMLDILEDALNIQYYSDDATEHWLDILYHLTMYKRANHSMSISDIISFDHTVFSEFDHKLIDIAKEARQQISYNDYDTFVCYYNALKEESDKLNQINRLDSLEDILTRKRKEQEDAQPPETA